MYGHMYLCMDICTYVWTYVLLPGVEFGNYYNLKDCNQKLRNLHGWLENIK